MQQKRTASRVDAGSRGPPPGDRRTSGRRSGAVVGGRDDVVDDAPRDVQGEVPGRADARVELLLVGDAEGAVPGQGLAEVRAPRPEDAGVDEDRGVPVGHGERVLVQRARRHVELAAAQLHDLLLVQRRGGARHGRVQAAGLLDVGHGVRQVGGEHLLAALVGAEVDAEALGRLLQLQEGADALNARGRAADAGEAHGVHHLVAELDRPRPPESLRQLLVHGQEDALQPVLLDEPHGVHAELLHAPDADVEEEALRQPRQDEERGVGAPLRERRGLGVLEPDAEHHEEDAPGDRRPDPREVVEVLERRPRPGLAEAPGELLQARPVGRTGVLQEVAVHHLPDRPPLGALLRGVVREEEDEPLGEEVGAAAPHAAEGLRAPLGTAQDGVAVPVAPAPDALAVPEVPGLAEGVALPEEEPQAAPAISDERDQRPDHVAPHVEGEVQRPPGHHRAVDRAPAAEAAAAAPDGEEDQDASDRPGQRALKQVQGQQEPAERDGDPPGVRRDVQQRLVHDALDGPPALPRRSLLGGAGLRGSGSGGLRAMAASAMFHGSLGTRGGGAGSAAKKMH
mmetsp:Transcript_15421/g.46247  ORF Transcript_15421/g.46247 Transcript_15421/m.46247 type:complete len:568 (+) Transcript_15421:338-2041(+)